MPSKVTDVVRTPWLTLGEGGWRTVWAVESTDVGYRTLWLCNEAVKELVEVPDGTLSVRLCFVAQEAPVRGAYKFRHSADDYGVRVYMVDGDIAEYGTYSALETFLTRHFDEGETLWGWLEVSDKVEDNDVAA